MVAVPTTENDTVAWLPPLQAARALGVSERTLRRHVALGRYAVEREGRHLRIRLPASAARQPAGAHQDDRSLDAALRTIQTLVEALTVERGRAAALDQRLSRIESRISQLQEAREQAFGSPPCSGSSESAAAAGA